MRNISGRDKLQMLEIIPDFVMGSNDTVFDEVGYPSDQDTCFNACAKFPYRTPQSFKSKTSGRLARFFNGILEVFDRLMNQLQPFPIFDMGETTKICRAVMILHLQFAQLPMEGERGFSRAKCLSATLIKQGLDLFQLLMAKMLGIGKLQTQSKLSMVIKGNFYQRSKHTAFENNRNLKSHFNHPYKDNMKEKMCQDTNTDNDQMKTQ